MRKKETPIMTGAKTKMGTLSSTIQPWDPKSEVFSLGSVIGSGSTTTLLPNTSQRTSPSMEASSAVQPETEEDGIRAGALRVAKYKHQYEQIRKRAEGKPATTASASSGKKPTPK